MASWPPPIFYTPYWSTLSFLYRHIVLPHQIGLRSIH